MARRAGGAFAYRVCKRLFDIAFSACALAVGLVPALVLCAFVARDTGGSPVYVQERVGMGGRAFRIYKLRTMVADSDDVGKYLDGAQMEQWRKERKVDGDPRITPLGRRLRETSLDEAPQFLNVLKGDMSVIGPRAVTRGELEAWFTPEERAELLSVPAGVTGLWQATARNGATFESGERQRIELEYVRGAGFAMDARVFARTFGAMFGRGRTGR